MSKFARVAALITLTLAVLAFPAMLLAQTVAPVVADAGGGLTWGAILAGVTAAAAILGNILNLIPKGYRTYASLLAVGLAGAIPVLTDLSESGQAVTLAALLGALGSAWLGKAKAAAGK